MARWHPVSKTKYAGFCIGFCIFLLMIWKSEPGYIFIIDDANLMFHEAGHPIFGIMGETMGLYGGTLGQLAFPVVLIIGFWQQRLAVSFAVGLVWFCQNLINIARYMADARAQVLPLLGGGEHDWWHIFTRWNVLEYDTAISMGVLIIAWLGIILTCLWLTLHTFLRKPDAS